MAKEKEVQIPEALPEPGPASDEVEGEGVHSGKPFVTIRFQRIADNRTYTRLYRMKGNGDLKTRRSSSRFVISRKWVSTRGAKRRGSV